VQGLDEGDKMPTQERRERLAERMSQTKKVLELIQQAMTVVSLGRIESRTLLHNTEVEQGFDRARDFLRQTQKTLVVSLYDDDLELMQ
jgi:hypothetical protein